MPVLDNARHERFAQELAKGNTQEKAYIAAGYAPGDARAKSSRLLATNGNIEARVMELKERAAAKVEWGIADAIRELDEARMAALAAETVQSSAAVNATMSKAKLLGLVVDKQQTDVSGSLKFERVERVVVDPEN